MLTPWADAILGDESDPYINDLQVSFKLTRAKSGLSDPLAEWICEMIVETLAIAAMKYLPKLPGFEGVSQVEDFAMEYICGDEG